MHWKEEGLYDTEGGDSWLFLVAQLRFLGSSCAFVLTFGLRETKGSPWLSYSEWISFLCNQRRLPGLGAWGCHFLSIIPLNFLSGVTRYFLCIVFIFLLRLWASVLCIWGGRLTLVVIILRLLIIPISFYYVPEWRWALYPCYVQ